MIRIILFSMMIAFLFACKEKNKSYKVKSKPFAFIDSILVEGTYVANILDFEFSEEILEIMLRMQKTMAQNKEWLEEYFSKNYEPGEGLTYHRKLGVTKEEYQKIKDSENTPPKIIVNNEIAFFLRKESGFISFKTKEERLKFMEGFKIDLNNEFVEFNGDRIAFKNEVFAPGTTPFGEWHGYTWEKETSNYDEKGNLKIDSLVGKTIELSIGKLKSDGKILLRIKNKVVDKGIVRSNFDLACYLEKELLSKPF